MKIVIASDSFKGSATSLEIADYVEAGIREVIDAEIIKLGIGDGGEGTLEALSILPNTETILVDTVDAMDRDISAKILKLDKTSYFIEMAQASGLTLVSDIPLQNASSYGTGLLIKKAIEFGTKTIYLSLGGTATNDLGLGLLVALGMKFYDAAGQETKSILNVTDFSDLPEISGVKFVILSDVKNPLYGKEGASHVFGPQKGLSPEAVEKHDEAFKRFSQLVQSKLGQDLAQMPGTGAAGGVGYAGLVFLKGTIVSGIHTVLDLIGFSEQIKEADYIITGEGKVDAQSLSGKVISGILERGENIPVVVLGGTVAQDFVNPGFYQVIDCSNPALSLEENMKQTSKNVKRAIRQFILDAM